MCGEGASSTELDAHLDGDDGRQLGVEEVEAVCQLPPDQEASDSSLQRHHQVTAGLPLHLPAVGSSHTIQNGLQGAIRLELLR